MSAPTIDPAIRLVRSNWVSPLFSSIAAVDGSERGLHDKYLPFKAQQACGSAPSLAGWRSTTSLITAAVSGCIRGGSTVRLSRARISVRAGER